MYLEQLYAVQDTPILIAKRDEYKELYLHNKHLKSMSTDDDESDAHLST